MKGNFLRNQASWAAAGPGHWNDPDMLQIGNDLLTAAEEKTHFALWIFAKAPLLIGCDLSTLSSDKGAPSLAILMNKELIAIHQDELGQQAQCTQNCDMETSNGTV